jgi:exopolyphosphatase/guanosine-5'-triphosphate,3'-diphosphate pyrophosphatase
MKVAVIDLGTNTFHLLIAEILPPQQFKVVYEEKRPATIGQGIIADEAYRRGIAIVKDYYWKIQQEGLTPDRIYAAGTSAVRSARNGQQFVQDIFKETGIKVELVSGDREAELIHCGVASAMDIGLAPALIMDIGGGSVEFIICNHVDIIWKQRFEVGEQRLIDQFMGTDPMPAENIQKLYDYLEDKLFPLVNAANKYQPQSIIGSSGTFDTLTEIYFKQQEPEFDLSRQTEYELPVPGFYMLYQALLYLNREQRLQIRGMIPLRADLIVASSCLVNFVLKRLDVPKLRISTYALKEGLLMSKLSAGAMR